ncbi:MAG TPA: septum formation initiator family protein [Candidatus Omnitrophota bacterium]|nr:septum formation initiator family protein [Candidatus Omnitrophota bacterium]
MLRYYGLVSDNAKLKASILDLKSGNEALKNNISALDHGDRIEALARQRLNFIIKGETAYKVCRSRSDRK